MVGLLPGEEKCVGGGKRKTEVKDSGILQTRNLNPLQAPEKGMGKDKSELPFKNKCEKNPPLAIFFPLKTLLFPPPSPHHDANEKSQY